MADNKIKFWPIRGTEAQVLEQPYYDGKIYFTTDTNRIYLDVNGSKHLMGGGNSGIVYANGTENEIKKVSEDDNDFNYTMALSALENPSVEPQADDLILNTDGRFFRVLSVDTINSIINVILLAVSGSGGGGGPVVKPSLTIVPDASTIASSFTYITGQHFNINLTITTTTEDDEANVIVEFFASSDTTQDPVGTLRATAAIGEPISLDVASINYVGSQMYVRIIAEAAMAETAATRIFQNIRFVDMHIEKHIEQNNPDNYISAITGGRELSLRYKPYGTGLSGARLHVSIDNVEISDLARDLTSSELGGNSISVSIPNQSHGIHTVGLWLSTEIGGMELNSTPITYEAAWIAQGEEVPVIWTGDVPSTVIQYENAIIPYMVYDPKAGATATTVNFYRNGVKVSENEITYSADNWYYWDVTALYQVGENRFTIASGISSKEVIINITTEGSRDLSLKNPNSLVINFDAGGRSSKEVKSSRGVWTSSLRETYTAELSEFNWYNNGWQDNQDGFGSFLSVANGASVRIPFKTITINQGQAGQTFEVRFRIRNAKKYGTLVTEIPKYRYTYLNGSGVRVDSTLGEELTLDQIAALPPEIEAQIMLDSDGNPVMNEKNTTEKITETTKNVALKYLNENNEGFCIGTQEAYFRTSGKTVNVRYKEGEIINISFVVDGTRKTLSIYLNGILSGAVNLNNIAAIDMVNIPFLINSEYCDFDLYKLRMYDIALTMPEVIHNYLADLKNIALYDENQLADKDNDTKLSYANLVKYNKEHPDSPTMPYAVIDMTGLAVADRDLPHFKGANKLVRIEFTNPTADYLVSLGPDKGGISEYEYYTHSPSFVADNVDINVQGTSSQIYPRRNFKTKFKSAKKTWVYTQGSLKDKPIADGATLSTGEKISKKWHMDSETLGTNKFTWKIDYMESSGSYNTGFANLVGSGVYDKHPLEDLHLNDVDASVYRTSVYGYPMLVFTKTDENEYTYIGRYNLNLDKGSNEYYGFEEEVEQPYIDAPWNEYEDDGETIAETHEHPWISQISECWELRDNQGTWCSFRYPDEARANRFGTLVEGTDANNPELEVSLHFEARYHPEADIIEAAQKYKTTDDDGNSFVPEYIPNTSKQAICNYLRAKFSNLERLFNWLDSTDPLGVSDTPANLPEPVTYMVSRESDDPTATYIYSINITSEARIVEEPLSEDAAKDAKTTLVRTISEGTLELTEKVQNRRGIWYKVAEGEWLEPGANTVIIYGTFSKDTVEYRKQKFYVEFEDHFDKHYCTIYFIMTELLLCYDSRGKNMMLATFGPHKKNGEYIWYPIFYDIDTQLGLNNVGAWLWDYNEDNSENRTFSTGTSVLWMNFYDVFENEIISTYQALRRTKLTYQTIEGAYSCDPEVFRRSYAMRGKRPIIALGLDEYYKYVLPTIEDWKHQDGSWSTADYLYACQGDRKLSRELLINNRLLYMDSKWMGGDFTISTGGMSGIMFRVTANQQTLTSDVYIDSSTPAPGQQQATYPVPYFDATPEFYVTPFLDFYVTTFVDEILYKTNESYDAAKYPNGIPTTISPSILNSFKSGSVDQQLNYFAGSPYISSLGDLSTKYVNQVNIENAEHLLDITLGSDVEGYFNNEQLDPFNLHTEKKSDGVTDKKPLLQKIILSNMVSLDKNLDTRGAGKLQEFRALGTKLKGVTFADGAPLDTVHLPNYVESLNFVENKNLTKLLKIKPVVLNNDNSYKNHEDYEGLYIEGLTDYQDSMAGRGSLINAVKFQGDALGYGSYEILRNLFNLKNGSGRTNRLKANFVDVKWTPYVQVEYGESQLTANTYYYLTDHGTYEEYTSNDLTEWMNNTLNGRIFTYNENYDGTEESTITDLSLLDNFITDRESVSGNEVNQFISNTEGTITASVPTITGELYVSNTPETKIDEDQLTSRYAKYWDKLKITAKYINEAYLGKYVQIDMNTGKEVEIQTFRYAPNDVDGLPVQDLPEKTISAPQTYDFRGWSFEYVNPTDSDIESKLAYDISTNSWTTLGLSKVFSSEQTVIKLYAVFTQTLYTIHYMNPDNTEITTRQTTYGQPIPDPLYWPKYDPGNTAFNEVYAFKGYTRNIADALPPKSRVNSVVLNLSKTAVTEDDLRVYAVYIKQDVHDEPLDNKYFTFTNASYIDSSLALNGTDSAYDQVGVRIDIKDGATLQGKVTLPSYYGNLPVVIVGDSFATSYQASTSDQPYWKSGREITHVFWYQTEEKPCKVRHFSPYAFGTARNNPDYILPAKADSDPSNLVYVEMPDGLRIIDAGVFMFNKSLDISLLELPDTLVRIGNSAFATAFDSTTGTSLLKIPGAVVFIGSSAFTNLNVAQLSKLQFGDSTHGSNLTYLINSSTSYIDNLYGNNGLLVSRNFVFSTSGTPIYPSSLTFYYTSEAQGQAWTAIMDEPAPGGSASYFQYYFSMIDDTQVEIIDWNAREE